MKIEEYNPIKITAEMMRLLLSADPDEALVRSYLPTSRVLVCMSDESDAEISAEGCIGIALITGSENLYELKNIAVSEQHQGKGLAKQLIAGSMRLAKRLGGDRIEVGTGNSSLDQLALYQKCGFRMFEIIPGFFESYPEPIIENGIRCIDMVRLYAEL